MFIGHFGVGFGAKAAVPRVSLGTLFLAAQFIDLLWPSFLLLGVERVRIDLHATRVTPLDFEYYPVSHSLLAVLGWAVLFAAVYQLLRRHHRAALLVGLVVLSHWLLDALVHRPDLPLYPGAAHFVGLGLWSSFTATMALEFSLFVLGIWLYWRTTRPADALGQWGLWLLILFLTGIYLGNLLGSPPSNTFVLACVGQAQWLLVACGYWVDCHRHSLIPSA